MYLSKYSIYDIDPTCCATFSKKKCFIEYFARLDLQSCRSDVQVSGPRE